MLVAELGANAPRSTFYLADRRTVTQDSIKTVKIIGCPNVCPADVGTKPQSRGFRRIRVCSTSMLESTESPLIGVSASTSDWPTLSHEIFFAVFHRSRVTVRRTVTQDLRKTAKIIGWPNAGLAGAGTEGQLRGFRRIRGYYTLMLESVGSPLIGASASTPAWPTLRSAKFFYTKSRIG